MKSTSALVSSLALGFSLLAFAPASAEVTLRPGFDTLAAEQLGKNVAPGARSVPPRSFAPPAVEVSPGLQALIAGPYPPHMNAAPKTNAEWKELINRRAALAIATLPALREKMGVTVEPTVIGGVKSYIVTPKAVAPGNENRLLVHVHGGGYVFGPGEAATPEAILMAGFGGFKVISIDYRMPPDAPYPAAMDDAMAVWKEIVKTNDPRKMAVFGTSTGGGMTLAMVLRAKAEGLPLPGAIAPGTPWSDLAKIGDTYETNEWVDNVLVSREIEAQRAFLAAQADFEGARRLLFQRRVADLECAGRVVRPVREELGRSG